MSSPRRPLVLIGSSMLLLLAVLASLMPTSNPSNVAEARPADSLHNYYFPIVGLNFTPLAVSPLWRYGVAQARRPITAYSPGDIASMRFGWYVDWGAGGSPLSTYQMDYVPMVRVRQVKLSGGTPIDTPCNTCAYATPATYTVSLTTSQIQALASKRRGQVWVIGNEIDRLDWGDCAGCGQDEITPALYATAYHDLYSVIKAADSTAQVAIGGMIEATPLRLEYLDDVWNSYTSQYSTTMPVDVWNIHVFVLQELKGSWGAEVPPGLTETQGTLYTVYDNKNFTLGETQLVNMRTWMKNHGQQAKPLFITEYGVNMPPDWSDGPNSYPFSASQVRDSYMVPSFNYLSTAANCSLSSIDSCHLVQRWNWYSLDDDSLEGGDQQYNGNLFYSGLAGAKPQGISTLGGYWKQAVQSLAAGSTKPY